MEVFGFEIGGFRRLKVRASAEQSTQLYPPYPTYLARTDSKLGSDVLVLERKDALCSQTPISVHSSSPLASSINKNDDGCVLVPRTTRCSRTVYYRFTNASISKSLETFETPKQLMAAIPHALIAHEAAYRLCGILHGDFSKSNITMMDTEKGVLYDWDIARGFVSYASEPMSEQQEENLPKENSPENNAGF
ncbi:hypothetical protein NLJ89_g8021 [Agrocybe chaxingu]|uniref:Fungal-type protein kinase domain-containing protein n=1 Tax=Agrocybe chaxingu TaxID=84603 RepID=A0A9W8MR68_9AGAR|nr:hypothetical protein NLJ89_g8021 [Agrocybe chaxingu]